MRHQLLHPESHSRTKASRFERLSIGLSVEEQAKKFDLLSAILLLGDIFQVRVTK